MKIRIVDDLNPEDLAMLQALYSRSAESVDVHIEKVRASGSGNFMSKFYVGYGHKSIADCGSTTMFIEGVSLLAAKAIQDTPLYSGQETSTRYIDMSKQTIIDPVGTPESRAILDDWMTFYTTNQDRVATHVREMHPMRPDEDPALFERACKARAFDILRGFLPAGITTQLSWHSNLRQAGDHLTRLANHPLVEVRWIARGLRHHLGNRYTSSGMGMSLPMVSGESADTASATRAAWERAIGDYTYSNGPSEALLRSGLGMVGRINGRSWIVYIDDPTMADLGGYHELVKTRPRGCVLPHFLSERARLNFEFLLDFGSFRDLQRHRNGVVRMPLLTTSCGFESWYLEQLTGTDLHKQAVDLILRQSKRIAALPCEAVEKQNYIALGFRVDANVTFGLPAAVYVMELRSSKTVHPTLRRKVHQMIGLFQSIWKPADFALYVDMDPDDWSIRRGAQTIAER